MPAVAQTQEGLQCGSAALMLPERRVSLSGVWSAPAGGGGTGAAEWSLEPDFDSRGWKNESKQCLGVSALTQRTAEWPSAHP